MMLGMSKGASWAAWSVAAIVAIVHFAVAGQYDIFRNELYFIACGRHPAFGYVDQPPLVPLIAAITQWGGIHPWLLRFPAVLCAIFIVPLTVLFAQLLGANTRAAWLASIASGTATLMIAMTATLGTSTFEAIDFTAIALLITLAYLRDVPRALWWAGAVAGLAFETRYGVLFWGIALVVGIAIFGPRALLRSRDFWIGAGIAALIALPNAIWQAAHGFPFLELVRNDNSGNFTGSPIGFISQQMLANNFILAPLWITGIVAPFVSKRLAPFRFLAAAFVITTVCIFVTHGKMYYMAGLYPPMFALGAAACTRLWRWFVALWAAVAVLNGGTSLPLVLPVISPPALANMIANMAYKPRPVERAGIGAPLMQMLSDEFGWRDLARTVESVYEALPPDQRAKAAIYTSNYGEAAAIDFYGHGLPPALSGNNNYYLWGTHGYDGSLVIGINESAADWSSLCGSVQEAARFGTSPYAMPYEVDRPIVICRDMHPPLPQIWPQFKHYGIENLGVPPR